MSENSRFVLFSVGINVPPKEGLAPPLFVGAFQPWVFKLEEAQLFFTRAAADREMARRKLVSFRVCEVILKESEKQIEITPKEKLW